MDMSYTMNPHLPHIRMETAQLVLRDGWSTRQTARHTGFDHSTIVRWVQRARCSNRQTIPTESSRPHHHPRALDASVVQQILRYRMKHRRCAEVLHYLLTKDGYTVSLSSVKRVLRRNGMSRFSPWKKWHTYPPRPLPKKPGILVEVDTIHVGPHDERLYLYTLLDVCSRWAYAIAAERITIYRSLTFIRQAEKVAPFPFTMLQSDHGPEFSKYFTKRLLVRGVTHRHSRVRTPNDNGHLERFNRTIQEECISRMPRNLKLWRKEIPAYLRFYNAERPHMGLGMQTPLQVVQRY